MSCSSTSHNHDHYISEHPYEKKDWHYYHLFDTWENTAWTSSETPTLRWDFLKVCTEVSKHWNRLPREVIKSASLRICKTWLKVAIKIDRGWTRCSPEVPSFINYSLKSWMSPVPCCSQHTLQRCPISTHSAHPLSISFNFKHSLIFLHIHILPLSHTLHKHPTQSI